MKPLYYSANLQHKTRAQHAGHKQAWHSQKMFFKGKKMRGVRGPHKPPGGAGPCCGGSAP